MTITFIGDSFTLGVGDSEDKGWVGRVCEEAGVSYKNAGVQGDTSDDITERWKDAAAGADKLVFCFGANDCLLNEHRRVRVGKVERLKNAKAIMMAASRMAPTLFISPFPIAENEIATKCIADTARQLSVVAKMNKVPYVNIFDAVKDAKAWHSEALDGDGAHPSGEGYTEAAKLIADHAVWQEFLSA